MDFREGCNMNKLSPLFRPAVPVCGFALTIAGALAVAEISLAQQGPRQPGFGQQQQPGFGQQQQPGFGQQQQPGFGQQQQPGFGQQQQPGFGQQQQPGFGQQQQPG